MGNLLFNRTRATASILMASLAAPMAFGIATAQETAPFESTPDNQLGQTADVNRTTIKALIDSDRTTANLTIHKFLGERTGGANNGTEQDVAGDPLDATFNIQRIGSLDPKKIEDWQTYAGLETGGYNQGDSTIDGQTLGEKRVVQTGDSGRVTTELPMGFYLVTEESKPGRTTIKPFLVALPMTNPNNTEWNYDVHVYPKNQEFGIEKQVSDAYSKSGDTITYTLTGDTVAAADGETTLSRYVMVDRQPENITVNRDSVKMFIGDTELAAGDFTVGAGGQAGDTKISLTATGLQKLFDARENDSSVQVRATMNAQVGELAVGDTVNVQTNTAYLFAENAPGNPDSPSDEDPNDSVESRYGKVTLNKIGSDTDQALEGAEFQLYRCAQGSVGSDEPTTVDGPLTVNGQDKWTTDDEGRIVLQGLQVDDFRNGATADDDFDYCFVEVKSPEGYELRPDPVAFEVNNETASPTVDITNVPDNGGSDLPFTGENGIYWILAMAGLLATGGLVMFLSTRKED